MGKVIGGAIAGYVVMFVLVMALMTAAWFAVGVQGAFQPGAWDVTPLWLFLMLAAAVVAGVVGGLVTASITKDPRAPMVLLGIVVVLGILFAVPVLMDPGTAATSPRAEELPMFEAMQNGKQPAWVALLNPVLGAVGVLLGARLRRGKAA